MCVRILATQSARGFQVTFALENRGRRECRMRAAPAISCAMVEVVRTRAYRAAEAIRHSLRNGFTTYFVLSPVNGFLATVAPKKLASQELDASAAASGPHDFTVRSRAVRYRHYQRPPRPIPRS